MKDLLKKAANKNMLTSLVILLFGVFIFLKPDMTVKTVSFLLGIILLISGLNNIVSAFNNKEKLNDLNIAIGIIIIVASLVLFFNPTIIASIIPLLIGIYMIISSAFKLQYLYSLKELTNIVNNINIKKKVKEVEFIKWLWGGCLWKEKKGLLY